MKKSIKIIVIILITASLLQLISCSKNEDVNFSDLGISYRLQKQDDWIYYAEYNYHDYMGGLWRVSSDGEEKEKLIDSGVDLFALYNNQIFYITHSSADEWILHTIDTEGKNERVLYQSNKDSSHIIKMDVVDGKSYALDKNDKLHIINLDSIEYSEFNERVADYCIEDKWLYYLRVESINGDWFFQLWRTEIDSAQNQQLIESYESAVDFYDNKIYYIDDEDGDIYSIDFFGGKAQKIIESEGIVFLKVIGDWIYYGNQDENPCIYKVKRNGKQNQKIDDYELRMGFSIYTTCVLDNWIWYMDMDKQNVTFIKMIRISDQHSTDDVIEDILEEMTPSWVIQKYE